MKSTSIRTSVHVPAEPRDEIAEGIARGRQMTGPHDFDGLEATGEWIVLERTQSVGKTPGGIIVPEAAQMPIWQVASVGPKAEERTGRPIRVGERCLFINPEATLVHDGRGFAIIHATKLVAVLRMPSPEPIITVAGNGDIQ
jgi:co-chaperonin GroES (HSP10)